MRTPLLPLLCALAAAFPVRGTEPTGEAGDPPPEAPAAAVFDDAAPEDPDSEYAETGEAPAAAAAAAAQSPFDPETIRLTARVLCDVMAEAHVLRRPFDESLSPRAWTNFVDSFDPQHLYFTAEDIAAFEPARTRYAALLAAGDVSFPSNVFARFVSRVEDRNAFVRGLAGAAFDFDADENYVWRRKGEPWTHEGAEQDALWTQRVKNAELAARVAWQIARDEAEAKGKAPSTNTLENAVASAREDLLRGDERFLDILRDSDEEFWLPRFFDAAMLAYDPHSNYMSPAGAEDFDIDMGLALQGIGATLQTDDGACKIVEIIPGSPAEQDASPERLVRGDKIVAVAQGEEGEFVDVRHWPLYKAVRLIRGPKGSTVRLRVIPVSDPDAIKIVTLVRDEIKLEEQAAAGRLERFPDETGAERPLGYVRLPGFYNSAAGEGGASHRSASEDVAKFLAEFNEAGAEGLILDLRGNGGGSLPEAIRLAGLFLRTGPIVLVREGRGRPMALPDNDPAVAFRKPVVVLVDRLSASASEIVAAALQDYGRALVVGDAQTHGKGTVQSVLPIAGVAGRAAGGRRLGSLKPTTALFYRVNGASTQLRGVAADIHLPSVFETYAELGEDKLPGALRWTHIAPSSFRPVDSLGAVVPELRLRSEARLATNEAWQARARLLDRFAAFNSNRVVSLRYDTRLERAREDSRLQRQIAELTDGGKEAEALAAAGPNALPDAGEDGGDDAEGDAPAAADGAAEGGDRDGAAPPPRRRGKRRAAGEPRVPGADPVLDEALSILVDLIDLHGAPKSLDRTTPSGYNFLDNFFKL